MCFSLPAHLVRFETFAGKLLQMLTMLLMSLEHKLLCPFLRNSRFIYKDFCRDRSDEAHQLITGDYPDAAVPLG